jgi:hypothetical protein
MLEKTSNILLRSMIYVIYVVEEYVGSFLMQVSGSFAVSQNRFMSWFMSWSTATMDRFLGSHQKPQSLVDRHFFFGCLLVPYGLIWCHMVSQLSPSPLFLHGYRGSSTDRDGFSRLASHRSMAFFELGALPRTEESQGIATMWGPQVYKPHYLTILIGIINHSDQSYKST